MDGLMKKYYVYSDILNAELSKHPFFIDLEKRTGVPKVTLVVGSVSVIFILIFFNYGGQIITDLLGWVYPAYSSFKAIESKDLTDNKQWLTYWTVFGFISVIEYFIDIILHWFPFWYVFKTLFVLWLALPTFRGAEVIYNNGLRQLLIQYAPQIDSQASQLRESASKVINGKSL